MSEANGNRLDPVVRTWHPPCVAWMASKAGIKRTVWVQSIVGQYALITFFQRHGKQHPVKVSDLRKPAERYSPPNADNQRAATGDTLD